MDTIQFKVLQDEINQTRQYLGQVFEVLEMQAKAIKALDDRLTLLDKAVSINPVETV